MRLEDCDLNFAAVMKDPFIHEAAERLWKEARNEHLIPESLFRLYTEADYLSLDKAPRFLADPERILFSYLAMLLNGLRDSLTESSELVDQIRHWEDRVYSPITKQGESKAAAQQRRTFRYLLLNQSSSLDLLAEVLALFFTGEMRSVQLGRALSSGLFQWVKQPLPTQGTPLISPKRHYLEILHDTLHPLVVRQPPEEDWDQLLSLYRNKLSHLGGSTLMDFRLHDEEGRFYAFLPREWPFTWQKHINFGTSPSADMQAARASLVDLIKRSCIHIDIVEYSESLSAHVRTLLDAALEILVEVYHSFRDFPMNQDALSELERQSKNSTFTEFR